MSDACGFAVPRLDLVQERDVLDVSHATKGPAKLSEYQATRNAASIDGLPGLPVPTSAQA